MATSIDEGGFFKKLAELQGEFFSMHPVPYPMLSIEDILPKRKLCILPEDLRSIIAKARHGDRHVIEIEGRYEIVRLPFKEVITAKVDAAAKAFVDEMVRLGFFESTSEAIRVAIYLLREVLEKAIQERREMLEGEEG